MSEHIITRPPKKGTETTIVGSVTADIQGDYVDDSAFSVASDRGLAVGGVFSTDTVDSGDFGVFAINAKRQLETSLNLGGVVADVNTGNASAGTQRVVLATDQPAISVDASPGTAFNEYGEDIAVASLTETTIVTYAVPGGNTANIEGFLVNGSATGWYKLKVDGTTMASARTSAADRTVTINFQSGVIQVSAGSSITITGIHEESTNQTMNVNVFGFLT